MKIIVNINKLLGETLEESISVDSKLKSAAAAFSIYAYEVLKEEFCES